MLSIHNYDVYIFDCDGVVLDSNKLKISAMFNALSALNVDESSIKHCIDYFKNNFGKSRYHHIEYFTNFILSFDDHEKKVVFEKKLLSLFSSQCRVLYFDAPITPGFLDFIDNLNGRKYIASGSAEDELVDVFEKRNLSKFFIKITGSPTEKSTNIRNILNIENTKNAVMVGDALSDLNAAIDNDIDFIAYIPFSNVPHELKKRTLESQFTVIEKWGDII